MDKMNCEVTISAQFQITTPVVKNKTEKLLIYRFTVFAKK
jgi:hypothetical protein